MKQAYIVLGMPGAGKDTQTEQLAHLLHATIIKTGDIARALAETNTLFAQQLQEGNLVDATIIEQAVADEIQKPSTQSVVVFNGFPRQLEQALWLDDFFAKNNISLKKVIYLKITRPTALLRLSARHRADDRREVIENRLNIFEAQTAPVVEHYRETDLLTELEAEGSINEVSQAIRGLIT